MALGCRDSGIELGLWPMPGSCQSIARPQFSDLFCSEKCFFYNLEIKVVGE
jgi:hypothetical protein